MAVLFMPAIEALVAAQIFNGHKVPLKKAGRLRGQATAWLTGRNE
jgi:hypothetical protein